MVHAEMVTSRADDSSSSSGCALVLLGAGYASLRTALPPRAVAAFSRRHPVEALRTINAILWTLTARTRSIGVGEPTRHNRANGPNRPILLQK